MSKIAKKLLTDIMDDSLGICNAIDNWDLALHSLSYVFDYFAGLNIAKP